MFQGVYFGGLSDFSLLFREALSSAPTKSIAGWSRLKILGFSPSNPLNIRIVSFQRRGLWEGHRTCGKGREKVEMRKSTQSTLVFLISLLLPVREHCAADSFHSNWRMEGLILKQGGCWGGGGGGCWRVGGRWGGVKVQGQAVAVMK